MHKAWLLQSLGDVLPEGAGGCTPDFKWQGWWNGAKNQNPPKSPCFQHLLKKDAM